jgi:hypothetical protein|nr:MAG TPA: hypothetical protein [Caudoviricetes sp.]
MKFYRIADPETGEVIDPKETPEFYTLDAIRHADVWTPENIKHEYQRLRVIAQKRLKRIEESEIGRASKTYYYNKDRYKPSSELKLYEMKLLLADLAKMMTARTGTLRGIKRARDKAIKTFHKHGYTFVNESNYIDLGEFFRQWKDGMMRGYGSTVALDFYEAIRNSEAFEKAAERKDKTAQILRDFEAWQDEKNKPHKKERNVIEKSSDDLYKDLKEFL